MEIGTGQLPRLMSVKITNSNSQLPHVYELVRIPVKPSNQSIPPRNSPETSSATRLNGAQFRRNCLIPAAYPFRMDPFNLLFQTFR